MFKQGTKQSQNIFLSICYLNSTWTTKNNQSQFQEINLKNKKKHWQFITTTLVIDGSLHEANYRIKPISVPRIHQEEKNIDGFSNRQQQLNSLHEANSTQFTSHEKTYY